MTTARQVGAVVPVVTRPAAVSTRGELDDLTTVYTAKSPDIDLEAAIGPLVLAALSL